MADRKLHLEMEAAQRLKDKLLATYGEDADLIRDCIEGETGLHEAIGRAALELAAADAEVEGVQFAIARLTQRLDRYKNRVEGIREAIQAAMETAELTSLKTAAATLSIKPAPPRVEIVDIKQIPAVFLKQPPPVPDKTEIKNTLKSGVAVPGATLSNSPPSLTVNFK